MSEASSSLSAAELWVASWQTSAPNSQPVTAADLDDGSLFGAWPRPTMSKRPLVLMHVQAVIGDVFAERPWPPAGLQLHLRPGLSHMLRQLRQDSQVALIAPRSSEALLVLRELRTRSCSVDAVLESDGTQWLDVSDACCAFGIAPHEASSRIVTIGAVSLSHEDIEAREGSALICDPLPCSFQPYYVSPLPLPAAPKQAAPVAVLLPNPRSEPAQRAVHCRLLLELLRELLIVGGGGGWPASVDALAREDVKRAAYDVGGRSGVALVLRGECVGASDLCELERLPKRYMLLPNPRQRASVSGTVSSSRRSSTKG